MAALYTPLILDHCAHPRNYGTLDPYDISYEAENSLCGDRVRIDLRLEKDTVAAIRFSGTGCAVSQAATSLLTLIVDGTDLSFITSLQPDDLLAQLAVPLTTSRRQCALLGLQVLQAGVASHADRLVAIH